MSRYCRPLFSCKVPAENWTFSDVHTITGGWGDIITPLITGHEVVGKVTAVGPKVKDFKVGDRAGVGAQVWSCMDCNRCKNNNENYCKKQVDTYNAKWVYLIRRFSIC